MKKKKDDDERDINENLFRAEVVSEAVKWQVLKQRNGIKQTDKIIKSCSVW